MFDQYEIIDECRPSRRPTHLATGTEKFSMLRELRIMGSNDTAESLHRIGLILGHEISSLDSLHSSDANKVVDRCRRLRHRQY